MILTYDLQVWPWPFINGPCSFMWHTVLSRTRFLSSHFKIHSCKCEYGPRQDMMDTRTNRRTYIHRAYIVTNLSG